jgi:hypothetical protein
MGPRDNSYRVQRFAFYGQASAISPSATPASRRRNASEDQLGERLSAAAALALESSAAIISAT